MAMIATRNHPKFKKLVRRLGVPEPYVLGHLECLWHTAYDLCNRDIHFLDVEEVEAAAEWIGDDGAFCKAAADVGLLDEVDGGFNVHDLEEHCPDFVKKRIARHKSKEKRQTTADSGGQRQTTADIVPQEENRREEKRKEQKKQAKKGRRGDGAVVGEGDPDPVPRYSYDQLLQLVESPFEELTSDEKRAIGARHCPGSGWMPPPQSAVARLLTQARAVS